MAASLSWVRARTSLRTAHLCLGAVGPAYPGLTRCGCTRVGTYGTPDAHVFTLKKITFGNETQVLPCVCLLPFYPPQSVLAGALLEVPGGVSQPAARDAVGATPGCVFDQPVFLQAVF